MLLLPLLCSQLQSLCSTSLPSPLPLQRTSTHPLHIFPVLLPPPPHKQNVHPWMIQGTHTSAKLNAQTWYMCDELNERSWNKNTRISPTTFHNPGHWPSPPFLLVLSLYRALRTSCSFFSAACLHWPSCPSRPASGELGIHLPSW